MYKELLDMDKNEKSLLLFLETCAVDNSGLIDIKHMNDVDVEIAEEWNNSEFILFGRLTMDSINNLNPMGSKRFTHWCFLSQRAFELAHQERTARADRLWNKRSFKRTIDK